jgi:hypothetical protein
MAGRTMRFAPQLIYRLPAHPLEEAGGISAISDASAYQ